jgi:hypothetical protein
MLLERETFNIYVKGYPFSGKTEVAHYLASMNGLNAYAESFDASEPQWDVLMTKGEIALENSGSGWSPVARVFNDHVLDAAYKIHALATTKKIKICNNSVLVIASILAPFLQDCED